MAALWSRNDNLVIVLPVFDLISIFTVDLDDKLCLDFFSQSGQVFIYRFSTVEGFIYRFQMTENGRWLKAWQQDGC